MGFTFQCLHLVLPCGTRASIQHHPLAARILHSTAHRKRRKRRKLCGSRVVFSPADGRILGDVGDVGSRYGLIGRNGKGKSTLLKFLASRRVGQ
jgi:ABC-type polysaccharide/polyol phosphate transport system ATPase subunit